MYRYISWLAVGSAAVFLLVAQASYPPVTVAWLALAITAGRLPSQRGSPTRVASTLPHW